MFCALAENLQFFKERMSVFVALAPAVHIKYCTSGLVKKMADSDQMEKLILKMDMLEVFPAEKNRKATSFFHKLLPEVSNMGLKLLADDDPSSIN
mmetsp:Transcript_43579/g.31810  ORF Transcript_43579/g.31810 Transcript_43579/m.31810 type:complete len:95 (+) Transcript_43579:5-289(+)